MTEPTIMYLTEVRIRWPEARQLGLVDDYRWHQALWQAFPDQPDKKRDFLTRVDRQPGGWFRAWLLSPDAPTAPHWGRWKTNPIAPHFFEHNRYAFSLRANPTKKQPKERNAQGGYKGQGQSRRVAIVEQGKLRDWFLRQAERHGFALDESKETGQALIITKEPAHRLVIPEVRQDSEGKIPNPSPDVRIHSVLFEGVLRVVPEKRGDFKRVFIGRPNPNPDQPERLIRGISAGKGFGFGLLVLVPLSDRQLKINPQPPKKS